MLAHLKSYCHSKGAWVPSEGPWTLVRGAHKKCPQGAPVRWLSGDRLEQVGREDEVEVIGRLAVRGEDLCARYCASLTRAAASKMRAMAQRRWVSSAWSILFADIGSPPVGCDELRHHYTAAAAPALRVGLRHVGLLTRGVVHAHQLLTNDHLVI